jgi:hypothetical protein
MNVLYIIGQFFICLVWAVELYMIWRIYKAVHPKQVELNVTTELKEFDDKEYIKEIIREALKENKNIVYNEIRKC